MMAMPPTSIIASSASTPAETNRPWNALCNSREG
jgi:hypothetical protein